MIHFPLAQYTPREARAMEDALCVLYARRGKTQKPPEDIPPKQEELIRRRKKTLEAIKGGAFTLQLLREKFPRLTSGQIQLDVRELAKEGAIYRYGIGKSTCYQITGRKRATRADIPKTRRSTPSKIAKRRKALLGLITDKPKSRSEIEFDLPSMTPKVFRGDIGFLMDQGLVRQVGRHAHKKFVRVEK